MQSEYLARLSKPVQEFVHLVESGSNFYINVILDPNLNEGGPTGLGKLAVIINADHVRILAPTNGYFPEGAVRHEVLHVHRFLIEGVPKLVLADEEHWDQDFSDALGDIDNAIEHVVIVPVELQFHPERREHWEAVMGKVWSEFPSVPNDWRGLVVCLHWTFLRHVLPDSPQIQIARDFMSAHALLKKADDFANQFLSLAASKEQMVSFLFLTFPEIGKHRAALEYIRSVTGTCQTPIP